MEREIYRRSREQRIPGAIYNAFAPVKGNISVPSPRYNQINSLISAGNTFIWKEVADTWTIGKVDTTKIVTVLPPREEKSNGDTIEILSHIRTHTCTECPVIFDKAEVRKEAESNRTEKSCKVSYDFYVPQPAFSAYVGFVKNCRTPCTYIYRYTHIYHVLSE